MKGRGQASFIRLPAFAAGLYDRMMRSRAIEQQTREIARELAARIGEGRLLDIGTGPGWMLHYLHQLAPEIQLYGLDISTAMVKLARRNLQGVCTDLRRGNIEHSDYPDDFFDLVTCTGSFYLWDRPLACLNEIHRILKPGSSAWLYETCRDYDKPSFDAALAGNLKQQGLLRRLITPRLLKRQLRMTYDSAEVCRIIEQSRFGQDYAVERRTLGGLPVWLCIRLFILPTDPDAQNDLN